MEGSVGFLLPTPDLRLLRGPCKCLGREANLKEVGTKSQFFIARIRLTESDARRIIVSILKTVPFAKAFPGHSHSHSRCAVKLTV